MNHEYNYIIKTSSIEENKNVQLYLFDLGYEWASGKKLITTDNDNVLFIYKHTNGICYGSEYYLKEVMVDYINNKNFKYFNSLQEFKDFITNSKDHINENT